jgi:hypothetical protein
MNCIYCYKYFFSKGIPVNFEVFSPTVILVSDVVLRCVDSEDDGTEIRYDEDGVESPEGEAQEVGTYPLKAFEVAKIATKVIIK